MRTRVLVAIAVAGSAVIAACGSQPKSANETKGQITAAFKGSPPPLAALHAQANQLLGGGTAAFKSRLTALHGYPVVVNEWASWCGPCQSEFPSYQRAAVTYGGRVAFMGLDTKDHNSAAASFLAKFPVTYPSYTDPQATIGSSLHSFSVYPQTLFFNRQGKMVYDKAGPYLSVASLEQDIKRYALG
jgi:thiol-disulfide isomerase/thioredoxin